jgi:hypothetical protein
MCPLKILPTLFYRNSLKTVLYFVMNYTNSINNFFFFFVDNRKQNVPVNIINRTLELYNVQLQYLLRFSVVLQNIFLTFKRFVTRVIFIDYKLKTLSNVILPIIIFKLQLNTLKNRNVYIFLILFSLNVTRPNKTLS